MPSAEEYAASAARLVHDMALARVPTLGTGRLICLDGPAGSGKTTLAEALARLEPVTMVHMDDLYEGWSGLARVADQLDALLRPLAEGRPDCYRRYDWDLGAFAETVTVAPADLLVLEGVGSGSSAHARLVTVTVWVDAPHEVRMRRGIDRDGDAFAPYWSAWAAAEEEHFRRERTRDRADVLVDGTGSLPPVVRAAP